MLSRLQLIITLALLPIWLIAANTNTAPQNQNQKPQGQGQQQQTKYYCPVSKDYKEYKNGNGKLENLFLHSQMKKLAKLNAFHKGNVCLLGLKVKE